MSHSAPVGQSPSQSRAAGRTSEPVETGERHFRDLVNALPQLVWTCTADGQCEFISTRWAEYTGVDNRTLMGTGWVDLVHPADRARVIAGWQKAVATVARFSSELRIRRGDGRYRWFQASAAPVLGADGRVTRWVGSHHDIDDRKMTESELARSEERFRSVFDDSPVGNCVTAPDGRLLRVNKALCAMLGYTAEELHARSFTDITHPDDREKSLECSRALLAGEASRWEMDKRYQTREGRWIWAHAAIALHRDGTGQPLHFVTQVQDITARKEADEHVRSLKVAVDQSPASVLITDAEGRIEYVNDHFTRITGYSATEVHGRKPGVLKSGLTPLSTYQELWSTIRGGRTWRGELQNRRKNGEIFWNAVSISPIRNKGGTITNFVGVQEDITRRKQAEVALQTSEQRYRELVEQATDGIVLVDDQGIVLEVNGSLCALSGYGRHELIGLSWAQTYTVEDRPTFTHRLSAVTRGEKLLFQRAFRRRDGSVITAEIAVSPLAGGRVQCIIRDVTERERAIRALRESEERFRQVAENIREALFVVDLPVRKTAYVSRTWSEIWGRPLEDIYRQPDAWLDGLHPEDRPRVESGYAGVINGEPHFDTFRVVRPDREVRWVRSRVFPLRGRDGSVHRFIGVAEDVTELKQVEQQLQQSQKMEAIGQLAAGVAHDFNNLLTVINGSVEFLLEDLGAQDPRRNDVMDIANAGKRAADLTRQLLLFSRQQILQPKVLDLNHIIENLEKMLRRLIGEDIELLSIRGRQLGAVKMDPGQMEQVLLNLVVNARDAMPRGGKLTIETGNAELDHTFTRSHPEVTPGPYVVLTVRDTGVGMTPDVMRRIFEPFFTTKERGKGTGLGLATVYAVVDDAHGIILVESEPDAGTTFTIYLPRVEEPGSSAEHRPAPRGGNGDEIVLVVEDEPAVRDIARRILGRHGYVVLEASDPPMALRLARSRRVNLLLTDVVMPGMSGRELADRLREEQSAVRVLYMSGYTDDAIVRHGAMHDGTALIQKPFSADLLLERVREVLDG